RLYTLKFQNYPAFMEPVLPQHQSQTRAVCEDYGSLFALKRLESFGKVCRDLARHLPAYAAGFHNAGDDHVIVYQFVRARPCHYSRISSTKRFFNFIPAPRKIVRIARAVRPCLPMTFPRSWGETRSSRTIVASPSISLTDTSSGLSTRAFATVSITSLN